MKPERLTRLILIGMLLGIGTGFILNHIGPDGPVASALVRVTFPVIGSIFVKLLKLLVVPLVLVSLICGTASLDDVRKLGRIGGKTMFFYLSTTAVAIAIAIGMGVLFRPGIGFHLNYAADFVAKESPPLSEVILDAFPSNPFESMASGNMLQVIIFAVLFGVAASLSGDAGKRVLALVQDLNEVVLKLVMLLMYAAPVGVFALVAKTFALEGLDAIWALGKYFFLVLATLAVHGVVTYGLMLRFFTGLSPVRFMKKMREAQLFAFSTSSSNATLPVTLETVEKKIGVKREVASFTIPLGATINMDGTAIMQGVATVFIAQALGVQIGLQGYLMVIVTATLASIGTAGVPGVGLVMLAMVFQQVNLPVAAIGVIYGVDRLLDMSRTVVNITGDAVVSTIVGKSEGAFDEAVFLADDE